MKKIMVLGIITILLLTSGCVTREDQEKPQYWEVIKSPITGKCYELYSYTKFRNGISEIPCSEYDKYIKDND